MVNKNDDEKMTVGELLQALARVLYELELAHEIVKELAKHLSVSEEEWTQIVDRAYSNLEKRKEEIVHTYFDAKNSK